MESSSGSTNDVVRWRAEHANAGNAEALQALRELITYPILYSHQARKLGLKWPRGLLLYGPPGSGKTSLVRAVVRECDAHLIVMSLHSVHRAHAGESEKVLRDAFSEASSHINLGKPSVIFIDEIDAICHRRDSRKQQDSRVASQLIMLMDSSATSTSGAKVVVVASTNRVDALDPALRRSGRFDAEIEVTTPNEEERLQILKLYTKKVPLDPSVNLEVIAALCNGYVGADLEALCREAAMCATKRCSNANEEANVCSLLMDDWKIARSIVGPSITRGVTAEIPKVSWDDIGGLHDLKKKLKQAVEWPLKHSEGFSRLGVSPMRGILLHGPPGCSKTTLAKAAAHGAQASFFSLSGAELFSMYVGEGEALLRNTFCRARLVAPSIIFFDEADVAAKRGTSSSGSIYKYIHTRAHTYIQGILVLAATNRPHAIDAALMPPGRFDLVLYVPPPDLEARYEILRVHTRGMKIDPDVDLKKIAQETERFTGAELEGLCREAGIVALREEITATVVRNRHFETVKSSLNPALTNQEIDSYASYMNKKTTPKPQRQLVYSGERKVKYTKKWLSGLVVPVTMGVVGVIVFFGSRGHNMNLLKSPTYGRMECT
ncbi:cell division control protein 48 homolog B-like [Bidens hawaiensis]|uniref:cell division control protein 48 homolog B-like n=1 Tax=Bidens hawaiensis TaxID=980011 RepID=UPI004049047C